MIRSFSMRIPAVLVCLVVCPKTVQSAQSGWASGSLPFTVQAPGEATIPTVFDWDSVGNADQPSLPCADSVLQIIGGSSVLPPVDLGPWFSPGSGAPCGDFLPGFGGFDPWACWGDWIKAFPGTGCTPCPCPCPSVPAPAAGALTGVGVMVVTWLGMRRRI